MVPAPGQDGGHGVATHVSVEVEYRYPMRRREWVMLAPAAIYGLIAFVLLGAWLIGGWGQWVSAWALLALSFGFISVAATLVWWLSWRLAMQNNAWVRLDSHGIEVRDWLSRDSRLQWEDVRGLYWRFGARGAPGPTLHIQGRHRTLHIPALAMGGMAASLLARQVAERAGLRCVRVSWLDLGGRYEA